WIATRSTVGGRPVGNTGSQVVAGPLTHFAPLAEVISNLHDPPEATLANPRSTVARVARITGGLDVPASAGRNGSRVHTDVSPRTDRRRRESPQGQHDGMSVRRSAKPDR